MIPFIRSLTELKAITASRDIRISTSAYNELDLSTIESQIQKKHMRSFEKNNEIELPNLPKIIRSKWLDNKKSVSRFFNNLDYNNQIQSSYDLTLIERQNMRSQKDVA